MLWRCRRLCSPKGKTFDYKAPLFSKDCATTPLPPPSPFESINSWTVRQSPPPPPPARAPIVLSANRGRQSRRCGPPRGYELHLVHQTSAIAERRREQVRCQHQDQEFEKFYVKTPFRVASHMFFHRGLNVLAVHHHESDILIVRLWEQLLLGQSERRSAPQSR